MPLNPPHEIPLYKFQKLEVYRLALEYADIIFEIAKRLPGPERFNLHGQIEAAVTSVVLNIAEGSTGQTDPEQQRFLSLLSAVAMLLPPN
jgi:four helix bundle protein